MEKLKTVISTSFSKFQIVGTRVCENCGADVNIIKTVRKDQEVTVSECLNCENLAIKKDHEEFIKKMDAKENEIIYERFSIVPDDLLSASFDNYKPEHPTQADALKKAIYYSEKFGELDFSSLLFKGSYGVGKSHLAKSISDHVKANGKTVIFIDIPQLLRKIKNTFSSSESSDVIYRAIEKADLVIFDDLGAEYVKKDKDNAETWVGEVLFELFSSRTGKPKIITTNCGSAELKSKYGNNGGRIVSRMMKETKIIHVEGKDMRTPEF
ncbi:MAG: ATP-binding protein [Bacillus sp. (in: firmicutes)]